MFEIVQVIKQNYVICGFIYKDQNHQGYFTFNTEFYIFLVFNKGSSSSNLMALINSGLELWSSFFDSHIYKVKYIFLLFQLLNSFLALTVYNKLSI